MTQSDHKDPALDPDLIAYADGALEPERMAEVEARLARDPEAREAVAQWRHFDNLINTAAGAADARPANLRIAALERELAAKLQRRRLRAALFGPGIRRLAASVVIFAAGWGAHSVYDTQTTRMAGTYPGFIQPTLSGHYAYLHNAQQRAEFSGDRMPEALDWLSEQMQMRIDSPKLERLGYQIESARLVMAGDQPLAVFYYRNAEGERVTVSMTPRHEAPPVQGLRMASFEGERVAYWSSGPLHYAVVASTSAAGLTSLAAAVED